MKMTEPKLYTRGVKLWVRFSLNGEVIKRSLNIEDSKANRKLATTQIIPQMLLKAHSGEFFENKIVPTIKEMIDISLKMNRASRKANTHNSYNYVLNKHVIPVFGNRKIDSIKASELTLWQNDLLKTLSNKAVINVRIVFNGIFQDALRDEIISKNPFSIIKAPQNIAKNENIPFSKEEVFRILDASPEKIKLFFAIGFFTGMRTGEITALKWSDIDLENKVIQVRRTRNKGVETTPKTKSSIRDVDILDVLLPYLENHLQFKTDNEYVFLARDNVPFNSSNKISSIYWARVLKELNIPYRNLYQMRHTFASMMIASGEDILWVSSMLGHKNANITLQVYAKYIKNDKKSRGTFLLN
jgi:integrase